MRGEEDNPSVARGLAVLAALSVALIALSLLERSSARRATEPRCLTPVEIEDDDGVRLGCAGDRDLDRCEGLARGARVRLHEGSCSTVPAGMSSRTRLLLGLKLDLNRASADDLALLEGVGPKLSSTIVADRERRGPFRSVAELDRVHGIGTSTVARIAPYVEVGREP